MMVQSIMLVLNQLMTLKLINTFSNRMILSLLGLEQHLVEPIFICRKMVHLYMLAS